MLFGVGPRFADEVDQPDPVAGLRKLHRGVHEANGARDVERARPLLEPGDRLKEILVVGEREPQLRESGKDRPQMDVRGPLPLKKHAGTASLEKLPQREDAADLGRLFRDRKDGNVAERRSCRERRQLMSAHPDQLHGGTAALSTWGPRVSASSARSMSVSTVSSAMSAR